MSKLLDKILAMEKDRKIKELKKKARSAYQTYHSILAALPCGAALGEYISSTASQAKQEFNDTMNELNTLDPESPRTRL